MRQGCNSLGQLMCVRVIVRQDTEKGFHYPAMCQGTVCERGFRLELILVGRVASL